MKMHYSGGLRISKNGMASLHLAGWAACVTGDKAYAIQEKGNHTHIKDDVTCAKCLNLIRDEAKGRLSNA